jgi:hypothetical protein
MRRFQSVDSIRFLAVAALAGVAWAPLAAAQDVLVKQLDQSSGWTPSQYENAEPLELPLVTSTSEELLDRAAEEWWPFPDLQPLSDVQVAVEGEDVPEASAIPPIRTLGCFRSLRKTTGSGAI